MNKLKVCFDIQRLRGEELAIRMLDFAAVCIAVYYL